jgi:GTP pyrophosphokinase
MVASTLESIVAASETYLPHASIKRLAEAYEFARRAHEGQLRFSGDPFITHPVETARILLALKPDIDVLVAALLHDVCSEAHVPLKEVEKNFGPAVAQLLRGMDKLEAVKMRAGASHADVWRRMVMAMAKDLRVVFIKLAERLHNLRTLEYVPEVKRKRIAEETLRVYAPIASRLGLYFIKSELEDLCFKHLYPREFLDLSRQLKAYGQAYGRSMEEAKRVLEDLLKEEGIEAEVSGRVKHLYSIYRKLKKKNTTGGLTSMYDLFAMRIVLPNQMREGQEFFGHCYTTLGMLHNRWTPLPGRFKDYVAVPKLNGYRSLHTTVIGLLPSFPHQPLEIQMRTQSMHQESEFGIAAHWWYEDSERTSTALSRKDIETLVQGRRLLNQMQTLLEEFPAERSQFERLLSPLGKQDGELKAVLLKFLKEHGFSKEEGAMFMNFFSTPLRTDPRLKSLQHQLDWLYGLQSLAELPFEGAEAESFEVELFNDHIFILTPTGEVKDLPVGSTAVDFAYAVHTDLGHRCHQARVNGAITALDQSLANGDVVEILTRKDPKPNRYWLSFVKTSAAKNKIKAWFRTVDREKNIRAGRELLNKDLRRLNKPLIGPNYQLLEKYGGTTLPLADREHVVELVGNGTLTVHHVLRTLFSEEELIGSLNPFSESMIGSAPTVNPTEAILVTGQSNLPLTLSSCCKPEFPHNIVGYVTRGKTIRIHRSSCQQLRDAPDERLLTAKWASLSREPLYHVKLHLVAKDRIGLLKDLLTAVVAQNMNVVDIPLISKKGGEVQRHLILEVSNYAALTELLNRIEKVPGVMAVKKV